MVTGLAAQAVAQTESLLPSTVVRLNGNARASSDGGKSWRTLKAGDAVESGGLIQTAFNSDLDLALGARTDQVVNLAEDTLLRLDRIASRAIPGASAAAEEISLDLRKGMITGTARRRSSSSRYEIVFAHGVAGLQEGSYRMRATGELAVSQGKAFIALTDGRPVREIAAGQVFDPATDLITALPPQTMSAPAARPAAAAGSQTDPAKSESTARQTPPPRRKIEFPSTGLRRVGP
jgi:hypothetical protein